MLEEFESKKRIFVDTLKNKTKSILDNLKSDNKSAEDLDKIQKIQSNLNDILDLSGKTFNEKKTGTFGFRTTEDAADKALTEQIQRMNKDISDSMDELKNNKDFYEQNATTIDKIRNECYDTDRKITKKGKNISSSFTSKVEKQLSFFGRHWGKMIAGGLAIITIATAISAIVLDTKVANKSSTASSSSTSGSSSSTNQSSATYPSGSSKSRSEEEEEQQVKNITNIISYVLLFVGLFVLGAVVYLYMKHKKHIHHHSLSSVSLSSSMI